MQMEILFSSELCAEEPLFSNPLTYMVAFVPAQLPCQHVKLDRPMIEDSGLMILDHCVLYDY